MSSLKSLALATTVGRLSVLNSPTTFSLQVYISSCYLRVHVQDCCTFLFVIIIIIIIDLAVVVVVDVRLAATQKQG